MLCPVAEPVPRLQGELDGTVPKYGPWSGRRDLGTGRAGSQMTWAGSTYSHRVLAQEALDFPGSIVDGEFRPILHVAGGFRGVIEAVNLWQRDIGSGLSQRGPGRGLGHRCIWVWLRT